MLKWIATLSLGLLSTTTQWTVIDGDTVRLLNGQRVRLQGFNAPEIHGQCYAEHALAVRAKRRLEVLSSGASLRINPGHCAYGRLCGTITVNGRDVGDILIEEGLAEPMHCENNRCPRPRDWCNNPLSNPMR